MNTNFEHKGGGENIPEGEREMLKAADYLEQELEKMGLDEGNIEIRVNLFKIKVSNEFSKAQREEEKGRPPMEMAEEYLRELKEGAER